MKRSGIFIAIGLFCLVSSCGDRDRQVEEALSLSGNNRNELEAVLKHYEEAGGGTLLDWQYARKLWS